MMPESPHAASDPSSSGGLGRTRKPRVKRTLATVLRERGALSVQHAVEVALDICDALSVAHANGVVHGQLGLGCVRLAFTAEGGPRDVEIFTLTADAEDSLAVPVAPFLEPERAGASGVRRVDARSDVWALGALLYAMLAGSSPPARDDATELVLECTPRAPRSLVSVIEACLAHDPESCPEGVEDVAERIASFATWPPDQFARIGARREKRAAAERVQRQLERRGLGNLPSVLDKLDDAALARAQRPATETLSSLLHQNVKKSTEAAMQRLMTAVHEGTDEARVELAARLPALVDFDDEDEEVLPTLGEDCPVREDERSSFAPVASPLAAVPVVLDEPLLSAPPAAGVLALALALASGDSPRARPRSIVMVTATVLAIVLGAGSLGYALSARASTVPTVVSTPSVPVATAASVPVFAASALPEAPPVTPASLPEAKPLAP